MVTISLKFPIAKNQIIFRINCFHSIISVFRERKVEGQDLARFVELLELDEGAFVEEELGGYFGKLMQFISASEPLLNKAASHEENRAKINPGEHSAGHSARQVDWTLFPPPPIFVPIIMI